MASGKSSVGRLVAQKIGWPLVDADEEIIRRTGRSIETIFQTDGEPAFRALEASVMAELCAGSGQVVATGGGAFLNPLSREAMLGRGLVFCLSAQPVTIFKRLNRPASEGEVTENPPDGGQPACPPVPAPARPLLAGGDALERIKSLIEERTGAYSQAHYSISTDDFTPEQVAEHILKIWNAERVKL